MKILISGYYGFENIGDEAVLGGIIEGLSAELPDVRPVVLSGDPESTRQLHGVDAIPRMGLKAIKNELRDTDLFISGGGSLLQDVTSFRSPLYYLGMLRMAQRANVPTMMLAQGVGPLRNPINRFLTRKILNRTLSITVRDGKSAEFLRKLGVNNPPIEVTADPSFLLTPDNSARVEEWWAENIPAGRPVIGVALRPWKEKVGSVPIFSNALDTLAQAAGAVILFLPMQPRVDRAIAKEMSVSMLTENRMLDIPLTPCEMLSVIGRCDFLVAMRLHALIFAVHRGVPAFGISYDPKVRDFAGTAKLPAPMAWEELEARPLTAALLKNWEGRATLHETLTTSSKNLTALARLNIEQVKELLS